MSEGGFTLCMQESAQAEKSIASTPCDYGHVYCGSGIFGDGGVVPCSTLQGGRESITLRRGPGQRLEQASEEEGPSCGV
jgi:hypothetical protein